MRCRLGALALAVLAGCEGSGQIAAVLTATRALIDSADRVRIAIHDRGGFDCSLAFGPRPDPIVPAVVLPIGETRASIATVPTGDRVLIVDLFDQNGAAVGIGCDDTLVVRAGATSSVTLELAGYPEVLATEPPPRAAFVSPALPLVVVFSEAMDPASIAGSILVTRSDGGTPPVLRDPVLDEEDPSQRTWVLVPPFALDLGVEYTVAIDEDRPPRSARGVPLRPFTPRTFTTDVLADPFRDGLEVLYHAAGNECGCTALDNVKRVMERLFEPGAVVRVEQLPYVVVRTEVGRDTEPLLQTSIAGVTMSSCAALEVAGSARVNDLAAGRECLVTGTIGVVERDCFCQEVSCDAIDVARDEPACTDP